MPNHLSHPYCWQYSSVLFVLSRLTGLKEKKIPRWIALITVILGMVILITGFVLVIGGTISSFSGNLSNYESSLTEINNSFIEQMKEYGLTVPHDLFSKLIQPTKILEYTATVLNTILNMMGSTFIIFLIIIFILLEIGSFTIKAMAIGNASNQSISYFSTIFKKYQTISLR